MKVWMKVYLLCMLLYFLVVNVSGIIMIEKNHADTLSKEIQQAFHDEENAKIIANTIFAIQTDQKNSNSKSNIDIYSPATNLQREIFEKLVTIYKEEGKWVELYNKDKKLVASNSPYKWNFKKEELDKALKGQRNYVLREVGKQRFLFITDAFNNSSLISLIKDISYLHNNRNQQYVFLLRLEIIGLILLVLITPFLSRYLTNPIDKLTKSIEKIISGNYSERVDIPGKDEVSVLALQFNKMAAEVESKIQELDDQGVRKQKFIDNLIHELRTPLTSIIGYSDFLMNNTYDQEVLFTSLKGIHSEGKRILESADKLMELILIKNQDIVNKKEENIKELLLEIANDMKAKLEAKNINLKIETNEIYIQMDKALMKGVMINLIDNAFKATEKGSTIFIGGSNYPNKMIYVRDEGKGIPESELDKVLEPFYMVDSARAKNGGGAGLGLSICTEIVSAHGAQLKIQSEIGKGTMVKIIF